MIYEVRTYMLRAGAVPEFEERYAKRLPARLKHSQLGAFWHTEFGPLNQVVHVYPYDDLNQRTAVRAALAKDPERNALPGGQDLIVAQESEIMIPAPFMRPLGSRDYGTSARQADFLERTALGNSLSAHRDLGVALHGDIGQHVDYDVGVFAGDNNGASSRSGVVP